MEGYIKTNGAPPSYPKGHYSLRTKSVCRYRSFSCIEVFVSTPLCLLGKLKCFCQPILVELGFGNINPPRKLLSAWGIDFTA
jgi:hypothetical protein